VSNDNSPITAQVILRSDSGRELTGDSRITRENLADYTPTPDAVSAARAAFREAGFETGEHGGIGFSIIGPRRLFERFFQTRVAPIEGGGYGAFADSEGRRELPLDSLPAKLLPLIVAVTFEPPAQLFGPESAES
jgi:hypothetical protein